MRSRRIRCRPYLQVTVAADFSSRPRCLHLRSLLSSATETIGSRSWCGSALCRRALSRLPKVMFPSFFRPRLLAAAAASTGLRTSPDLAPSACQVPRLALAACLLPPATFSLSTSTPAAHPPHCWPLVSSLPPTHTQDGLTALAAMLEDSEILWEVAADPRPASSLLASLDAATRPDKKAPRSGESPAGCAFLCRCCRLLGSLGGRLASDCGDPQLAARAAATLSELLRAHYANATVAEAALGAIRELCRDQECRVRAPDDSRRRAWRCGDDSRSAAQPLSRLLMTPRGCLNCFLLPPRRLPPCAPGSLTRSSTPRCVAPCRQLMLSCFFVVTFFTPGTDDAACDPPPQHIFLSHSPAHAASEPERPCPAGSGLWRPGALGSRAASYSSSFSSSCCCFIFLVVTMQCETPNGASE